MRRYDDDICEPIRLKKLSWRKGRQPSGAVLHSPREPGELSQWGRVTSAVSVVRAFL